MNYKHFTIIIIENHIALNLNIKKYGTWRIKTAFLSVIYAVEGIASVRAAKGISLVAVSTFVRLIQAYLKQKNCDAKSTTNRTRIHKFELILNEIKRYLRDGEFNDHDLILKLQQLLDYEIFESTADIDKYDKKYIKKYKKRSFNSLTTDLWANLLLIWLD